MNKCPITPEALDNIAMQGLEVLYDPNMNTLDLDFENYLQWIKSQYVNLNAEDINAIANVIAEVALECDLGVETTLGNPDYVRGRLGLVYSGGEYRANTASDLLIDSEVTELQTQASEKFLLDCYGSAVLASDSALKETNCFLVDCFFFGRGTLINGNRGTVNTSAQLNRNIQQYLDILFSRIIKFLRTLDLLTDEEEMLDTPLYTESDGKYVYTGIFEKLQSCIDRFLKPGEAVSALSISKLYLDSRTASTTSEQSKLKLDAYNAYVFLKHFDDYVVKMLGKTISIKPSLYNKRFSEPKYTIGANTNSAFTTFRDSDPDVEAETSKIVKLIINTCQLYSMKSGLRLEERFLTFLNFEHIVAKIKAMYLLQETANIAFDWNFLSDEDTSKIWDSLSESTLDFIRDKRLSQVIADIRTDDVKALLALFELFSNNLFFNKYSYLLFNSTKFSLDELDVIYSIYKNLFDTTTETATNSVYSLSHYTDKMNYIQAIALTANSIFLNSLVQIVLDSKTKEIRVRYLTDITLHNITENLKRHINENASEKFTLSIFEDKVSEIIPTKDGDKVTGVKIRLKNTNICANITFNGQTVNWFREDENGNEQIIINYSELSQDGNIIQFIDDFTKIGISQNPNLLETIAYISNSDKSDGMGVAMQNLMNCAARVVANTYVTTDMLHLKDPNRGLTKSQIDAWLKEVLGEGFEYLPTLKVSNVASPTDNATLKNVAKAIAILLGLSMTILVKDSNLATQNRLSFSRLCGSIIHQWELLEKKENSASRHFSILHNKELFKGYYGAHELYTPGTGTKAVTDFTTAELTYAGVMQFFVPALFNTENKKGNIINNGNAMILASVNSDKNLVGFINTNINTKFNVDGVEVALKDCTPAQFQRIISKEIGQFYANSLEKVLNDFYNITELTYDFLSRELANVGIYNLDTINIIMEGFPNSLKNPLDYGNNFRAFHEWFNKNKPYFSNIFPTERDFIHKLTLDFNIAHKEEPIEIIDILYTSGDLLTRNESLVAQCYTFLGSQYLRDMGIHATPGIKYYTQAQYWQISAAETFRILMDSNFEADLYTDSDVHKKIKEEYPEWVNEADFLVYAQYESEDGEIIKISSKSDVYKLKNKLVELGKLKDYSDLALIEALYNDTNFKLNPIFEKYNYIDFLISQEWQNAGVGTFVSHPDKSRSLDTLEMEASRFSAQTKRNVSWTAQQQLGSLNTIDGIHENGKIAVIDDLENVNIVLSTDKAKTTVYDGATISNPFMVYLENYSLCANAVGTTKKNFAHFKKEETGTGGIIKTACYGLTNLDISQSPSRKKLMKKMTLMTWDTNREIDITKDFFGESIDYGYSENGIGIYYRDKNGNICKITDIVSLGNNIYRKVFKYINPNTLEESAESYQEEQLINSNYTLWEFFGAENSLELETIEGLSELVPSELSIRLVVKAMNNVGYPMEGYTIEELKERNHITLREIYQPLKHSDILWIVTKGAIKHGGANINRETDYFNDNYLNFLTLNWYSMGPLLDKEHHAESAKVSLMTLVMSGAAQTPFTRHLADNIYTALSRITELGIKEFIAPMTNLTNGKSPVTSIQSLIESTTKILVDSLASEDRGTFAEELAYKIKLDIKNKLITYRECNLPISDSTIFNKSLNAFSNYLSKVGIKLKVDGVLCVLNPSYELLKIWDYVDENGNRREVLYDLFHDKEEALNKALQWHDEHPVFSIEYGQQTGSLSNVDFGRFYKVLYSTGIEKTIKLTPNEYYKLKSSVLNGDITKITEYSKNGRNLSSYNARFKGAFKMNGMTVVDQFQIFDLDSVRFKHLLQNLKKLIDWNKMLDETDISNDNPQRWIDWRKNFIETQILLGATNDDVLFLNQVLSNIDSAINFFNRLMQKDMMRLSNKVDDIAENFNYLINAITNDSEELKANKLLLWAKLFTSEYTYERINYINSTRKNSGLPLLSSSELIEMIQNSDSLHNIVRINNYSVGIDKTSMQIQPYELIAPKLWRKEFGFSTRTKLSDVLNDKDYFIKLIIRHRQTKIMNNSQYDFFLLNSNGEHTYILLKSNLTEENGLKDITDNVNVDIINGETWRLKEGKPAYKIPNGARIYENSANIEVIVCDTLETANDIISDLDFDYVNINSRLESDSYAEIVNMLYQNKNSKNLVSSIIEETDKAYSEANETVPYNELLVSIANRLNNITLENYSLLSENHPIIRQGRAKYNSFLKSLDIVAARIPAQSMQSFMAMKIVAFEDRNVNNAYVSDVLFFLQGSK